MSCLLWNYKLERVKLKRGGGEGGGEMSSQYYYIRQSNCSLKLVEKEKKIMDYKQIQFDRKQTNEIKSND